jgi:hypothetical protein
MERSTGSGDFQGHGIAQARHRSVDDLSLVDIT